MYASQSAEIAATIGAWVFIATLIYIAAGRILSVFHHIDGAQFHLYERWWFSPLEQFRVARCFSGSGIKVCVPPFSRIKCDKKGRPITFSMDEIEHRVKIKTKHGHVHVQYIFAFVFEINSNPGEIAKFIDANDLHHVEKAAFPVLASEFERIAREYLQDPKRSDHFSGFSAQTPSYYADQICKEAKKQKVDSRFGVKILHVKCDAASGGAFILVPATAPEHILKAIGNE